MSLKNILAISGNPGLYVLKNQTRAGFMAQSLLDGKRISVGLRHNVSMLNEIAIYTYTEEVPLAEVFKRINEKEAGGEAISHKSSKNELVNYFSDVLPEYDEDRVYPSDMKKVVQWYNLLHKKELLSFEVESVSEEE